MNSILIVDDDRHVLEVLATVLQNSGHVCCKAEDVQQAKKALAKQPFDLLLTDLNLPGESGVDLIGYVKQHYPETAVVIASILDDPLQVKDVLDLGVYGYIVKPFTKNLVLITVENALQRHRLELKEKLHTRLLEREVAVRTKSLDEQLHFLQTLIDVVPVPLYYKDAQCVYIGCNQAFADSLNMARKEIIGRMAFDLYPAEVATELHQRDLEILKSGGLQVYERTKRLPNGTFQIAINHKAVFKNIEGKLAGFVGVLLDITDQKRTEQSLRTSEEKIRSIMDNLQIGVIMFNAQLEIMEINRQMGRWFPHMKAESSRENISTFLYDYGHFRLEDSFSPTELFGQGKSREIIQTYTTAAGERVLRLVISPVHNESQVFTAAIGFFEDITDKLFMERELNQTQKLESIGQLAAGIAHEINTPAQFIGSNIGFLDDVFLDIKQLIDSVLERMRSCGSDTDAREIATAVQEAVKAIDWLDLREEIPLAISQSQEGIRRINTIVHAMKEFSHPSGKEKAYYDLNKIIQTTIVVASNEWKYNADVVTDFAPDLPMVLCLADELGQVFLNMLVNAAHAIENKINDTEHKGKGTITFTTRQDGENVEIRIADTGSGIPAAIRDRIFDPFFTTKGVGKGTGQGLAIARDVITQKHAGTITFSSVPGEGTEFILRLPVGAVKK